MIVRGAENLPLSFGGVPLPTTARMQLQVFNQTVQPLEYVPIVNIPTGNGMVVLVTLAFSAANLNTLEGCVRLLANGESYPGTLLATGTEGES